MCGGIEHAIAPKREPEDGRVGQPLAQRRPVRAIVGRDNDANVGAGVERAIRRVHHEGIHRHVGQVAAHVVPRMAAFGRLEDVAGRRGCGLIEARESSPRHTG